MPTLQVPVDQIQPSTYLAQTGTSSLAAADTCTITCDPTSASCDILTGACDGVTITHGPAAMDTVCVHSTCVQAPPGSIEVQYALAPPATTSTVQDKAPSGVRASPAHFALAAHAMVYGCLSATGKLLSGEGKGWSEDFTSDSADAADSVTPIGAHVLRKAFRASEQ